MLWVNVMSIQAVTIEAMRQLIEQVRDGVALKAEVQHETRFVQDLGFASLELVGLVFLCERTFKVRLANRSDLISRMQTVGQAMDAIHSLQMRLLDDFKGRKPGSAPP